MTDEGGTKAARAVIVAALLLVLTTFAAANFVLVDVRLPSISVRMRLAWVAAVPGLGAFLLGVVYGRLGRRRPAGGRPHGEHDRP